MISVEVESVGGAGLDLNRVLFVLILDTELSLLNLKLKS